MSGLGLTCVGLTTLDMLGRAIDALPDQDHTALIQEIGLMPAGTAAAPAMVAARLGLASRLVSAVGDDAAGRFVRTELEAAKVDVSLLTTRTDWPTSMTMLAINSRGERPHFHAIGAGIFVEATPEAEAAVRGSAFVHYAGVGGPYLDNGPGVGLLQAAKAAGATVTCDLIAPNPSTGEELARILPHVDVFLPSAAEAFTVAETDDPAKAAEVFLSLGADACVIKLGARGVYLACKQDAGLIPAFVVEAVDTTSCGDGFCGGFITALSKGNSLREACRFGAATAAKIAMGLGTLGKLVDFDDTLAAMSSLDVRAAA